MAFWDDRYLGPLDWEPFTGLKIGQETQPSFRQAFEGNEIISKASPTPEHPSFTRPLILSARTCWERASKRS